jgi:hypothetical protein
MISIPISEAALLNISSSLAAALGFTPIIIIIAKNLITLKSDVHFQETHLREWFVKEKLEHSCSLRRDHKFIIIIAMIFITI